MMRELSEGPSWLFIVPADDNGKVGKIARSGTDETTEKHSFSSNLINSSFAHVDCKKRISLSCVLHCNYVIDTVDLSYVMHR